MYELSEQRAADSGMSPATLSGKSGVDKMGHQDGDQAGATSTGIIVLVHPSRLFRECLKDLISGNFKCNVMDYADLDAATAVNDAEDVELAILALASFDRRGGSEPLDQVAKWAGGRPLAVIGDTEDPTLIVELLRKGIKGYLPTTLSLEVWVHALRFVLSGGVFAPVSAMLTTSHKAPVVSDQPSNSPSLTAKQMAVVEAIRRGKANKVIAYELNMCESTVKVHVRTIMRKLKATNRTQVAYIANELLRDRTPEMT
ncbi:MAG: response regulator transcription factor [Hyphomicrobiaceae bacterium]